MQLEFVSAEEASKWPEGCKVLKTDLGSEPIKWTFVEHWRPDYCDPSSPFHWAVSVYSHFARLPDTLPEIERNE